MKRFLGAGAAALVLLLILPVNALAAREVIPVGSIVGIRMRSGSVTVASFDDLPGNPAKSAGIQVGDEIIAVGGTEVRTPADVQAALEQCGGETTVTVRRGSGQKKLKLTPRQTAEGYRLGVYLRQGVAGIGTVTWYDPATGTFGALGHGVNDTGGGLLEMTKGSIYPAEILSVKKGRSGAPGQLRGTADGNAAQGEIYRNSPQGVFGVTAAGWQGAMVETAELEDLHTGPAVIRSTVTGETPRDYSVEILKIYPQNRADGRNMLLKVTDPELLNRTGGIVQGMSGSPILQDGKLIGAVTHVLVGDPSTGYGIYIGNMLDAAA